jgi:hypothetical protein
VGNARKRSYRSLFVTPLTADFSIDDKDRKVTILRVAFGDHTT